MNAIRLGKGVFIVAEISANHNQNLAMARKLIAEAKRCGADAVKFQLYTPDTLTIDERNRYFRIDHPRWGGQTLYQLYKKTYTPWKWFKKLKACADSEGISFFATAFDKTAIDFLSDIKVPVHKIASFELPDIELVEYAAKTKKPLILSTGMATTEEIKDAVGAARKAGAKNVFLLKCVSSYPAKVSEMNLRTIPEMARRFGCGVGLSDHTLESVVSIAAVSLGAVIIEKHFTLSRRIKTSDNFFSLEPEELKELVHNIRVVEKSLGSVKYGLTNEEKKNRIFRRSLFAVKDIKKGERFDRNNIRSIRPGYGLSPKYISSLVGRRAKRNIKKGDPLIRADI